jgi:arylformamidase
MGRNQPTSHPDRLVAGPERVSQRNLSFGPDAVPYLKKQGIRLIGLDVPSVDPIDSKTLPAHHALWEAGIHILEGAVLDNVEEGMYELIALPLPILGGDGSPVRAVIRPVAESL